MAKKRHKPEEIVAKLRQVEVLTSQGESIAEAVKTVSATETTYFRWRAEYGGLKTDQVKRLKDLELENARLRRAAPDLTLDKLILTEAARGNLVAPPVAALAWIRLKRRLAFPNGGPAPSLVSLDPRSANPPKGETMRRLSPPTLSNSPKPMDAMAAGASQPCCATPAGL